MILDPGAANAFDLPGWFAAAIAVAILGLMAIRPIIGIASLLAFYPLLEHVPRTGIPGVNAETILVSFIVLLTLGRSGARLPPLRIAGVVLAFVVVVSAGWFVGNTWIDVPLDQWTPFGRLRTLKSRVFAAVLFFVGYWWARTPSDRRLILEAISAGVAVVGLGVLADLALGIHPRAPAGFFVNRNIPADYLATFCIVSLHLATRTESGPLRRGIHFGIWGIGGVAAVATLSRSGWLALAVGHLVWFAYVNRAILVTGVATAVVVLTLGYPLLPEAVRDRFEETFQTGGSRFYVPVALNLETSAASRVVNHLAGLEMFLASPIYGHGGEAFYLLSVDYGAQYGKLKRGTPHSVLLKMATEHGLLGLLVLSWLVLALWMVGRDVWRRGGPERAIGPMILAIAVSQISGNLFHTGFMIGGTTASGVWLLLGLGTRLSVTPPDPEK